MIDNSSILQIRKIFLQMTYLSHILLRKYALYIHYVYEIIIIQIVLQVAFIIMALTVRTLHNYIAILWSIDHQYCFHNMAAACLSFLQQLLCLFFFNGLATASIKHAIFSDFGLGVVRRANPSFLKVVYTFSTSFAVPETSSIPTISMVPWAFLYSGWWM